MQDLSGIAIHDVYRAIDLIGVGLNGVLGGQLARRKHFDAVGFVILAVISATGGGIIRDVMLQQGPPVALTDPLYILVALAGAAAAFLWKLRRRAWAATMVVADGVVLGAWAATGAMKTLEAGFGAVPAVLLGLTTAIGGGMIRDIAAGNVPSVFGGNNLYATPALVSTLILIAIYSLGLPMLGLVAATAVASAFTVLAHWRKWQLPVHTD